MAATTMSAMSAIAAQPVEDKRGNWDSQEQELWPVELPPQMHDGSVDEELAELKTLEERILHKYTPAKLDLDSHPLPPSSNSTATAFVQEEANSYPTVKPCATCFGIGKVYEHVGISDSSLRLAGDEGFTRVIESSCKVCRGMAILGDATTRDELEAPELEKRDEPIARILKPEEDDEEFLDDAAIEAKFGPSPFLKR